MHLFFHTLDNGIRLVHMQTAGIVAHCGLVINTGSRDESFAEHGMAHFIEHMVFKGTEKRKAYYILSRLEDVGGELNAYTTKEETAIHASFMKNDYERAMEIIQDIAFNSVFPEKEIEKEKDVVIEEINSYLDSPAELIFDDFEEMIFGDQPISHNILGNAHTVKSFTRKKVSDFFTRNYSTNQMVFCSVGNLSDKQILRLFLKYFEAVPAKKKDIVPSAEWIYRPSTLEKKMDTFQTHCIIGNIAYNLKSEKRLGMFLLNNILGGVGLNSRLNLSLREKNGLAYNVESNYNPYYDTGAFTVYFGTDDHNLNKSISIAMSELNKLCTEKLGNIQLSKARNQIKGYLARGYESYESLMLSLGKSLLVFGKIETLDETCRKIDKVTASELMETANEIFKPDRLSTLIYR